MKKIERTFQYLGMIADYPLSVLVDHDGTEWTWCEARSAAIAIRGRVDGIGAVPVWRSAADWRPSMRLLWAPPRRKFSRVLDRDAVVEWAGAPWFRPEHACRHCGGTGIMGGAAADLARVGALARGVVVDRRLLARLVPLFDPGALVVDARPDVEDDPIRLRSVSGGARAAIARMRGHSEGLETCEAWSEARAPSRALAGPRAPVEPRTAVEPDAAARVPLGASWTPSAADLDDEVEPVRRERTAPLEGPGDRRCTACGNLIRAGQCVICRKLG